VAQDCRAGNDREVEPEDQRRIDLDDLGVQPLAAQDAACDVQRPGGVAVEE
jgi:hypothetical protein